MLEKNEKTMWQRDGKGELIPRDIEFEVKNKEKTKEKALIVVLTRPELSNVLSGKAPNGTDTDDNDGAVIAHCSKNPSFTIDEARDLKKEYCAPFVEKILEESGLRKATQEELKKLVERLGGMKEKKS